MLPLVSFAPASSLASSPAEDLGGSIAGVYHGGPPFVLTLQNIQNLPTNDEITQAVLWIWSLGYTGHNCPANLDLHPPRSTAAAAAAAAAHFLFRSLELAQEEVIPCFSTTKDH